MTIYLKYFYNTCSICHNQYVDGILREYCSFCFDNKTDIDVDDIQEDIGVKQWNILDDINDKPLNILEQLSKY